MHRRITAIANGKDEQSKQPSQIEQDVPVTTLFRDSEVGEALDVHALSGNNRSEELIQRAEGDLQGGVAGG